MVRMLTILLSFLGTLLGGTLVAGNVHAQELNGNLLSMYECWDFLEHFKKNGREGWRERNAENYLCYRVGSGDTLWGIADHFLPSPWDWHTIETGDASLIDLPRHLWAGEIIVIPASELSVPNPLQGGGLRILGIDTVHKEAILSASYSDGVFLMKGQRIVDGPFANGIRFIDLSSDGNHLAYRVSSNVTQGSGCFDPRHIIVDGVINKGYACGFNIELQTFSESGSFAVRMNDVQGRSVDRFIVFSTIGNGTFYDFSDSLAWMDDQTLVYRAREGEQWHVVVNNVPMRTFDYLENLRVEGDHLLFSARHNDGSWTQETLNIDLPQAPHHVADAREDERSWKKVRFSIRDLRPRIGVLGQDITPTLQVEHGLPSSYGFYIGNIDTTEHRDFYIIPESVAEVIGLREKDIILRINGELVMADEDSKTSVGDLNGHSRHVIPENGINDVMADKKNGETIILSVLRNGVERDYTLTLGSEWLDFEKLW